MKKIISTLLIFSVLACFTMAIGSFANNSTNDTNSSISFALDGIKYGFGTALNKTKYGLGYAANWTKNTTAWNWTTDKAGLAKNWIVDIWCKYIGKGCSNSTDLSNVTSDTDLSNQGINQDLADEVQDVAEANVDL